MKTIEFIFGLALSLVLFAMMMLSFTDVIGRYFFNAPVEGGYEIVEFGLAFLVYGALPIVCLKEKHISIDLFDNFFSGKAARIQRIAVNLICALSLTVVAYQLWVLGGDYIRFNEVTPTFRIPLSPACYAISISAGLSSFVLCLNAWRYAVHGTNCDESELTPISREHG